MLKAAENQKMDDDWPDEELDEELDDLNEDWLDDQDDDDLADDDGKAARCPECGGAIYAINDKCPECGYWLTEGEQRALWSTGPRVFGLGPTAVAGIVLLLVALMLAASLGIGP